MTPKVYAGALSTILMSAWLTPWLDEMVKLYLILTVAFITLLINTLFWWTRLRETIINHLVTAIIQRVLMDPDIQKLIDWSTRRVKINKDIKEKLKRREIAGK